MDEPVLRPFDPSVWAVYGDYLQQQGDVRGEKIVALMTETWPEDNVCKVARIVGHLIEYRLEELGIRASDLRYSSFMFGFSRSSLRVQTEVISFRDNYHVYKMRRNFARWSRRLYDETDYHWRRTKPLPAVRHWIAYEWALLRKTAQGNSLKGIPP